MNNKILKPLISKLNYKKKIFAFDVETYFIKHQTYTEQRFMMGSVVGKDFKKVFWEQEEMAKFLLSKRLRDSYIFATNLEFDLVHVYQNSKYEDKIKMLDRNGIIYGVHRKIEHGRSKRKWEFLDTYNYTGKMKLEKMGNQLGIKKLSHPKCFGRKPKDIYEKIEMENYNLRDSEITYKYADFLINNFCKTINCKGKITIASTGLDYWRRNHLKQGIFQESKDIIKKHYLGSFHGGRTECIIRGLQYDLFYYDYNSHYPARCKDGVDGRGSYPLPSSYKYSRDILKQDINEYEGITKATVSVPYMHIPLLPYMFENKLLFPSGKFTAWFCNVELRKAVKVGYNIEKLHEGIYYTKTFKPFIDAIDNLYDLRLKYKKENNVIMANMIKTMMNGGMFGKFAQKIDERQNMVHENYVYSDDEGSLYYYEKKKLIHMDDFVKRGNWFIHKIKTIPKVPVFIMPILSSYTTALGRIKLWDKMNKSPEDVVYCDTDSIITKRKMFESSDKLGELKLEHKIKEGLFIKPKMYRINEQVKIKGVGRAVKDKKDFDKLIKTKEVDIKRFTRLKESFVRKMPFSSIIHTSKMLSMEDDKRAWHLNFNPRKFEVSDSLRIIDGVTEKRWKEDYIKAQDKHVSFTEQMINIDKDLIDWKSKGNDITKEEFIENELDWKMN